MEIRQVNSSVSSCSDCPAVIFEVLSTDCLRRFDDSLPGKAMAELHTLQGAIRKLLREDFPLDRLKTANSMKDLAPVLGPMIEGNPALLDPWGKQYLIEKREEYGQIVIAIRSSHELKRRCFELK